VKDQPVGAQALGATIYMRWACRSIFAWGRTWFSHPITTGQPLCDFFGRLLCGTTTHQNLYGSGSEFYWAVPYPSRVPIPASLTAVVPS